MKISLLIELDRRVFDFGIKQIFREFFSIEQPGEQVAYARKKLQELVMLIDRGRKGLGLMTRIKRAYLVEYRHLDLILNGLLKMAEEGYHHDL
jgi:hypothetical protein